jgi:hypothetical protein
MFEFSGFQLATQSTLESANQCRPSNQQHGEPTSTQSPEHLNAIEKLKA